MSSDLLAAHRHTAKNRREIEASTVCGCFYCMQTFSPDEVVAFTGLDEINLDDPDAIDAETAVCPRCGSESVIGNKSGYEVTPQFLSRMHDAWFQKTIIRKPSK